MPIQPKQLSNDELLVNLENEFERERQASHRILLLLREIQIRRLYADRGYSSMFAMLIEHFRLSESAANDRLRALELIAAVPAAEEKLIANDLNLTTLAMAQRQIRREEKVTGIRVTPEKKSEIVHRIANKTQAQAEKELLTLLPESANEPRNTERRVSAEATRVNWTIPDRLTEKIERLKELWSHVDPGMDSLVVLERAVDLALKKVDPLQKHEKLPNLTELTKPEMPKMPAKPRAMVPAKQRVVKNGLRPNYYPVEIDRELWHRSNGQCEYVDSETGKKCTCRRNLERDHIIPLALGGSNELSNLRLLCRTHNLTMARRHFGDPKIDAAISKAAKKVREHSVHYHA